MDSWLERATEVTKGNFKAITADFYEATKPKKPLTTRKRAAADRSEASSTNTKRLRSDVNHSSISDCSEMYEPDKTKNHDETTKNGWYIFVCC